LGQMGEEEKRIPKGWGGNSGRLGGGVQQGGKPHSEKKIHRSWPRRRELVCIRGIRAIGVFQHKERKRGG